MPPGPDSLRCPPPWLSGSARLSSCWSSFPASSSGSRSTPARKRKRRPISRTRSPSPARPTVWQGSPTGLSHRGTRSRPPRSRRTRRRHSNDHTDYVLVDSSQAELDYLAETTHLTHWTGKTGVPLTSALRKLAFAVRFGDINVLISPQLTSQTQVLFNQAVQDRVAVLA